MLDVLESKPLVLRSEMDSDQFFRFCAINRDLRIERSAAGELIIMAPLGGSGGRGETRLTRLFDEWAEKDGTGTVFNSNTGFNLPNGATRSPDISWVTNDRLEKLSQEEWEKFLPLCPDFVLELRSRRDSLRSLKEKMEEYIENGARLGWLLDPFERQVHIYRPDAAPQILNNPSRLSGNAFLSGFTLDILALWRAMEKGV